VSPTGAPPSGGGELVAAPPYAERDPARLVAELEGLTLWHRDACPEYGRIVAGWTPTGRIEDLPFVHVGLFKQLTLRSQSQGSRATRTLLSSSTSGSAPSRIPLDARGSELQGKSSQLILEHHLGPGRRPLLILDSADSLRRPGEVSARVAAALSLRPLASELHFLLRDAADPDSLDLARLREALGDHPQLIVYGFTWMLHLAWGARAFPAEIASLLAARQITFVHSGGWKKLETLAVSPEQLEGALLAGVAPGSSVLDYYGLVEQVGVIYPLCREGARHVPRWAAALVRDPWTLAPLDGGEGQLQLMSTVALAAPHHSVLTEDMARLLPGDCACGNPAPRFQLLGRMRNAEVRGCANV
jgi:hypothetical protein